MALSYNQILSLAMQDAHAPQTWTTQAQNFMIMELSDLCQNYDFEVAAKTYNFFFNPGLTSLVGGSIYGSGPYPLPADFLRVKDPKSVFWSLNGVPYPLIPIDLSEFDMAVQQAGTQSYPWWFATDMSPADGTQSGAGAVPQAYVYPPPSGAYPVVVRYQSQMPAPVDFTQVPWFPNQGYLRKKVAAMLMGSTDDSREREWMDAADAMLDKYAKMKDNKTNRAQVVQLDRRRFGSNYSKLPNTKTIGW